MSESVEETTGNIGSTSSLRKEGVADVDRSSTQYEGEWEWADMLSPLVKRERTSSSAFQAWYRVVVICKTSSPDSFPLARRCLRNSCETLTVAERFAAQMKSLAILMASALLLTYKDDMC